MPTVRIKSKKLGRRLAKRVTMPKHKRKVSVPKKPFDWRSFRPTDYVPEKPDEPHGRR